MIILKLKGIFNREGKIVLSSTRAIDWKELSVAKPPQLPNGSSIELTISFDENDFLTGKNGIVWATYDLRQAEIIQNTLLAQHINCEVKSISLEPELELKRFFLLSITNDSDINTSTDFIWRKDSGLCLKPDWSYPPGTANKSFELWLNGH